MTTKQNTRISTHPPKSLNDIIRSHREEVEVRLSNVKEIDALVQKLDIPLNIKDEMENWRLVSIVDKAHNTTTVLLMGDSKSEHHPGVTSPITTIDFEKGVACTKNHSIYKLGNRGLGEPPESDLNCLCAAMHTWGRGRELGVPNFSY